MAKIPLAIDKNYCASWGVFAGVRELLQNAKDADEDGYKMTIEHFPRTARLVVTNANIYVDPSKLLILGKSDKMPGQKRGQFGEGFVLGTLALLRKGHDVKFTNGDLSWTISFEQPDVGHPFEGQELLTFKSRKVSARETDFKIEIDNIPIEVWNELKKLFLFLDPPKAADILEMSSGTLLLAPARKGQVFSRGIFVKVFEDLACGYDMKFLELDRDRNALDEWSLHYKLGSLWQEACSQKPALAAPRVYEMAKADAAEVRQLKYHADAKLLKHVRERFEEEQGPDASPVTTMAAAKEAESVGAKPVVVSNTLQELLEKGGLSAATVAARMEGTIEERFAPGDLTREEWVALDRVTPFLPSMSVVTFRGTKAACRLINEDKIVGVERRLLSAPFKELLTSALTAEAKRRNVQPLDILLEHVAREAEPPAQPEVAAFETCDECGKAIPDGEPSMMNCHHHHSCSLYEVCHAPAETTPL
jgi:hypothetical protein